MSFPIAQPPAGAPAPRPAFAALMRAAQLDGPDGPDALNVLMTELRAIVWQFLRPRLSGWRDASDITSDCTQETLVRLFLGYRQCRAESDHAVIAWACTTARHALQDLLRSPESGILAAQFAATIAFAGADEEHDAPNRRALDLVGVSWDAANGRRPEEHAARETLLALAVKAYDAAAAETGEMLWWRLIMGAEWSDVAEQLGTTQTAAKRRFQRAQIALRQALLQQIAGLPDSTREPVMALVRRYCLPRTGDHHTGDVPSSRAGAIAERQPSVLPKSLRALGRRTRRAAVA